MSKRRSGAVSIPVSIGDYLATIVAPHRLAAEIRSTLGDVLRADGPRGATIAIRARGTTDQVSVDGRVWEPGQIVSALDQLIYVLLRVTLDHEADLLHLHTGYVARSGVGVFLAGVPRSGKSTLVAQMVEAEFDYLTDERVGVDRTGALKPMPKPISLVAGDDDVVSHLNPAVTGNGSASDRLWHIPIAPLGGVVVEKAQPKLIVFVAYREGEPLQVNDVHPAEAVRLLLSDSPDAGRFGPDSIRVAAGLVAPLHCVEMCFSNGSEAIEAIGELLDQPTLPKAPVTVMDFPGPRTDRALADRSESPAVPTRSPGVAGIVIGGRCVLSRPGDTDVIELDELASSWLQLVDGVSPLTDIVNDVAEVNGVPPAHVSETASRVIADLIALGVVE